LGALFLFSFAWIAFYHSRIRPARPAVLEEPDPARVHAKALELRREHGDAPVEAAAVLLLADDQWASAAAAALSSAGVPFTITTDADEALRHPLVVIPFAETEVPLTRARQALFEAFVKRGGTLVVQAPAGDPWAPLTGLLHPDAGRRRRLVDFEPGVMPAGLERSRLAGRWGDAPLTRGLQTRPALGAEAAAAFDDGAAAVLRRRLGAGVVYTLGVDLRDAVLRPRAGRGFDGGLVDQGLNADADSWAYLLLRWYQAAQPRWARLRAVPGGSDVVLGVSHSVETTQDAAAAVAVSSVETNAGVRATWFFRAGGDGEQDEASALDQGVVSLARGLAAQGQEIGSHAVLHAFDFESLRPTAAARGPYRPTVTVDGHAEDADAADEAAVSRARLERFLGAGAVEGFRAPLLGYPATLSTALEDAGYSYDSSLPTRLCQSSRPFFLPVDRGMWAESPVVELPPAFEDETDAYRPDGAKVDQALSAGSAFEATVIWALRPSAKGAAGALLRALNGRPAGTRVMTLREAARFWRARSKARFSLKPSGSRYRLSLSLPRGAPELSFELFRPVASCRSETAAITVSCDGGLLTVTAGGPASGEILLRLR
jgi:hypothetical protein